MFANGRMIAACLISLLFNILIFSHQSYSQQQNINIFDVRNTLALSDDEPTYKDYYLNAGSERGLKAGMVITVTRSQALYDSYQNKSPGELRVEVGQVKLIHVQKGISVARDYADVSRVSHPILDYDFVMIGDELDLETITTEAKEKRKTAAQEPAPTTERAADEQVQHEVRREGAAFAIDFASKSPQVDSKPEATPVSTLQ